MPLKKKVPYDQLRPYVTSELHNIKSHTKNTTPSYEDIPLFDNAVPQCADTTPLPDDTIPSADIVYNGNTFKDIDKNAEVNNTTTGKIHAKRSQKVANKQNSEVLRCSANSNPGKLALSMLQKDYWLTDEHIDHVQWLISRQFPAVKGFHSVLAFESKPPKVETGLKGFVQILIAGGSHWVTVTNIGCNKNKIKVYDSLYQGLSASDKSRLAALLNTTLPNLVIEWPRMQKQEGTSDCGLFATAVAIDLCSGHDPSEQTYDQSVMREHLAMCFMCSELAVFPRK